MRTKDQFAKIIGKYVKGSDLENYDVIKYHDPRYDAEMYGIVTHVQDEFVYLWVVDCTYKKIPSHYDVYFMGKMPHPIF